MHVDLFLDPDIWILYSIGCLLLLYVKDHLHIKLKLMVEARE